MAIKSDRWITRMAREHRMIEPFAERQVSDGRVSFGVSSYGYDIRVADEFKIFTNVNSSVIDPKAFDPKSFIDFKGPVCIVPPNSFALAKTVEYFRIPRNVLTICVGKCLTGDTRVISPDTGAYLPIREFVAQRNRRVVSLENWMLRRRQVTAHLNNGVQPVFELRTRAGLRIKATATHPFRAFEGWKPLGALMTGDRIAVARSLPFFGDQNWPEHEAILLGLLLADGQCHTPGHSPRYTTGDPVLVEAFTTAARAFGCEVSPVGVMGYNIVNHRGRGGIPTKNRAARWLEGLGCNVRSKEKFVPQVVFTARQERVATFLQALFSGDGSAYRSGEGLVIEYSSMSERLVDDVRHLLLRFGVFGLVRRKRAVTGEWTYRVQITDQDMIRRFAKEVGFLPGSRKQRALDELVAFIPDHPKRRSNFDTLPHEAWAMMYRTAHAVGRSVNGFGVRGGSGGQSLPYTIATQVAEAVADPEFTALVEADVVWDAVESITLAGEEPVYDLTVPSPHNFVANDLVVHNSTYARCGIIVNVTPFEPTWEGYATLEISNTTPLPAKIYANEGIAQVLFFESDEECLVSYKDRKGKYQGQQAITLPKVLKAKSSGLRRVPAGARV